jgi:hypothetical protein
MQLSSWLFSLLQQKVACKYVQQARPLLSPRLSRFLTFIVFTFIVSLFSMNGCSLPLKADLFGPEHGLILIFLVQGLRSAAASRA